MLAAEMVDKLTPINVLRTRRRTMMSPGGSSVSQTLRRLTRTRRADPSHPGRPREQMPVHGLRPATGLRALMEGEEGLDWAAGTRRPCWLWAGAAVLH